MILYSLRSSDSGYQITKFDDDLNPEATYTVSLSECDCPAGVRPTCRHRKMLGVMVDRCDSAWFYNYDTGEWHDPFSSSTPPVELLEPSLSPSLDANRQQAAREFVIEQNKLIINEQTKPWRRV